MPFNNYRDNYDAETLAILPAALDELGLCLMAIGAAFDQEAQTPRD